MIRINLLGEKVDKTAVYVLQVMAFVLSMVLVSATCLFAHDAANQELESLTQNHQLLSMRLNKLRQKTKKVEKLEEQKKLLKDKLLTIATLKANKQGPVRVLDDLSNLIPEHAWLTDVTEKGSRLELGGVALDNQTIAGFMSRLEQSNYFEGVELLFALHHEEDGVKLKKFSLSAGLSNLLEMRKDKSLEAAPVSGKASEKSDGGVKS